ncbi:MAG: YecA family protein [Lachnospiraceae bacterium]
MKSKEQIIKFMKGYKAGDVRMLYELMVKVLLGNEDFRIARNAGNDDICSVIEEETEERIDFSLDTLIRGESLEIFNTIEEIEFMEKKLKKADRIELIGSVLGDPVLFEGFCLSFYSSDKQLERLCEIFGCTDNYQELVKDPVYQKRRRYMRMVTEYTLAAVNLYGVIHLAELEELIIEYENMWNGYEKYTRETGTYQNTILFTPRFMGLCTLQHLIGNIVTEVVVTMDGFVLHGCFLEEYQRETEDMVEIMKELSAEGKEIELDEVFGRLGDYSYRHLHRAAAEKPMYLPAKKEFLKYAEEDYYEISIAETQFKRFLERKYLANFARVAEKIQISSRQCMDDFMKALHDEVSDARADWDDRDPDRLMQFVVGSMEGYGIPVENMDQANEFLGMVVNVVNSTRLWRNHGHSPSELTGIRSMNPQGIQRESQKSARKVYPNDPCPCGSGKKFKKCCGRR